MGGTEVYCYNLSKELAKSHKVFIFFRIKNPKEKEYALSYNMFEGLGLYSVNRTFRFCNNFTNTYSDVEVDRIFNKVLDETKPDIIHIQHLLFLSRGIVREIKKRNIPIVYTLHDYWLICYRGQLINDQLRMCKEISTVECQRCLRYLLKIKKYSMLFYYFLRKKKAIFLLSFLKKLYFFFVKKEAKDGIREFQESSRYVYYAVNLFIAPSRFVKSKFIENKAPSEKIIYSVCGFNKSFFLPKEERVSNTFTFAYIGTLLPMKGVDILISAFKGLKNKNIELSIYGRIFSYSGFEYYPKYLKKITRDDERIKFKGEYNNSEINFIFSNIDILVVPSVWLENSPFVVQEAFLSKTPVIGSRIGGMPELVLDGINGLLFKPGDTQDLQNKMEYVLNNPDAVRRFKENIPEVKSIENNSRETEEIYSRLIKEEKICL